MQTVAMLLTAILIPNLRITGPIAALVTVVALAFVNSHLWDAALFFRIPDTFTMHAAALLISNGIIFWILVKLLPGIEVDGFWAALVAPIVFTILSILISKYGVLIDWNSIWQQCLGAIEGLRGAIQDVGLAPQAVTTPED